MVFGPNPYNFTTSVWPNLSSKQLQTIEKRTIQAAKSIKTKTCYKVKTFDAKRKSQTEKWVAEKSEELTATNHDIVILSKQQILLKEKGQSLMVNLQALDLIVDEPPTKEVKIYQAKEGLTVDFTKDVSFRQFMGNYLGLLYKS